MRVRNFAITAALFAAFCGTARAQSPVTAAAAQSGGSTAPQTVGDTMSHWTASGFVGTSFHTSSDLINTEGKHPIDFGGQVAYLWKGIVGPEFMLNVSPNVKYSNIELADNPDINSYMFNVLAAIPLGATGRFKPFVSGGWGSVHMHTDVFAARVNPLDDTIDPAATITSNQSTSGNNIGFGVTTINGHIGFRGDVRYFRTPSVNTLSSSTAADQFTEALMSGLHFWRANAGIAFNW